MDLPAIFCAYVDKTGAEKCFSAFAAPVLREYTIEISFPCGSAGKEATCNAGDLGSIPGWEDPLEKGKATHYSILAWRLPWNSP